MKRDHEDIEHKAVSKKPKCDTPEKRLYFSFTDAIKAGRYEMRLLVSSRSAGGIIGRKGENIKRLRSEYDAQVAVPDSQAPERTVNLVATPENIVPLFQDVMTRLEDLNDIGKLDVRFLVHQSHAGALIGRAGAKIRELREKAGTQIKIYQALAPKSTDRICLVTGDVTGLVQTARLIVEELRNVAVKGGWSNYDTTNYAPHLVREYGGFPCDQFLTREEARSHYEKNFPHNPPIMRGGTAGTSYGGMSMQQMNAPSAPPPPPPALPSYVVQRPLGNMMPHQIYTGQSLEEKIHSDQVTIPAHLGGAIIGKNGKRIKKIRDESGAAITVEPMTEKDQRIITLTGTSRQIELAQWLLQNAVRSSNEGQRYYSEQSGRDYR